MEGFWSSQLGGSSFVHPAGVGHGLPSGGSASATSMIGSSSLFTPAEYDFMTPLRDYEEDDIEAAEAEAALAGLDEDAAAERMAELAALRAVREMRRLQQQKYDPHDPTSRSHVMPTEQDLMLIAGGTLRRCTLALGSDSRQEVDWALAVLLFESRAGNLVIDPSVKLLDVMVDRLHSAIVDLVDHSWTSARRKSSVANPRTKASQPKALDADMLYWGVTSPSSHSLWLARQLSLIWRNLSFVAANEQRFADHELFLPLILDMLSCEDHEISDNARHCLANVSVILELNDEELGGELLGRLFGFLYGEPEMHVSTLETFVKLAVGESSRRFLFMLDDSFYDRLDQLLFSSNVYVQDLSVSLLALFSSFGPAKVKQMIATKSAGHLITILTIACANMATASITREELSLAEHTMTAVYHLAISEHSSAFEPYLESFLKVAGDIDDSPVREHLNGVRTILYNIIVELGSVH